MANEAIYNIPSFRVNGQIGIGVTPSAHLNILGSTGAVGTAPIKLTAGTLLGVVENGTMEYDGTNFYLSTGGVRSPISVGGALSFVQGGNTFGADAALGTNDNFNLIFRVNNAERVRINTSGLILSNATTDPSGFIKNFYAESSHNSAEGMIGVRNTFAGGIAQTRIQLWNNAGVGLARGVALSILNSAYGAAYGSAGALVNQENAGFIFSTNNTERGGITAGGNWIMGPTASINSADATNALQVIGKGRITAIATSDSILKVNTLEFQPYALNNGWLGENVFFDSANFKHRATGAAGLFYFAGAEGQFRFYSSQVANTNVAHTDCQFKVNANGTVAIGGSQISSVADTYTGASLIAKAGGRVLVNTTIDDTVNNLQISGTQITTKAFVGGDIFRPISSIASVGSTAVVQLGFEEITTGSVTYPRIHFNYTGTFTNAGFTNARATVRQWFFGMSNEGIYGGVAGADSGRFLGYYDFVGATWRYGFNASGEMYLGSTNTTSNIKLAPTATSFFKGGRFLVGTDSDDGVNMLQVAGTAKISTQLNFSGTSSFVYADVNFTRVGGPTGTAVFQAGQPDNGRVMLRPLDVTTATSIYLDNTSAINMMVSDANVGNTSTESIIAKRGFFGNMASTTRNVMKITSQNHSALTNALLMRGLYVDVSNADWTETRAIENTVGNVCLNTTSGSTIIGGTTISAVAKLQVDSTTQGFLPPRMDTTQRDAIAAIAGLVIYNTTTNKHQGYNGATWNDFY